MHVSRSPTARCTSAAATAESTPPERAQMTLPSDPVPRACASTRALIAATVDSMKLAGVHVARARALRDGEEAVVRRDRDRGGAVLAASDGEHVATQLAGHQLRPVAD